MMVCKRKIQVESRNCLREINKHKVKVLVIYNIMFFFDLDLCRISSRDSNTACLELRLRVESALC